MRRACDRAFSGISAVLSAVRSAVRRGVALAALALPVVALSAMALSAVAFALPAPAAAQEPGGRAVEPPSDAPAVIAITLVAVAVVLLVAVVGYLYRRERGLDWDFQRPEEPAGEEEAGHGAH